MILEEDCDMTTSISETLDIDIKVFPNPSNDVINIQIDRLRNYKATLYDLNGRIIDSSKNAPLFNIQTKQSGFYLLEIVDINSGIRIIERIIVSK